jgi:hypothetical protein
MNIQIKITNFITQLSKPALQDRKVPNKRIAIKPGLFLNNFKIISMSLLNIIIILVVTGVLLWLVNTYIPMDGKIKNILNVVIVIAVILWLLRAFGVLNFLSGMHI